MNLELQQKIVIWRQKLADGTITIEEMREAVAALREGRKSAGNVAAAGTSRRAKAKAVVPSADDMLNELGGI